jgi:hypothetical protein
VEGAPALRQLKAPRFKPHRGRMSVQLIDL